MKASNGPISANKIKYDIRETISKFGDPRVNIVEGSPTKLELSAREGLGEFEEVNDIKEYINNYMIDFVPQNKIKEIEVFLPDGTSVIGTWDSVNGLFIWL
jgi:hypothetical protein